MKKIFLKTLVILTLVAFCLTLSACARDENTLVMATNVAFPPYEFYDNNRKIVGIDAEIAAEIAKKLGMKLKIMDVDFDSIVSGVAGGKYDIGMAGMTVTEDRKKGVNFSDTYATGIQSVIVRENCEYESFEEFYEKFDDEGNPISVKSGIKIGVQMGTTGDMYAVDEPQNWGFGRDNVSQLQTGADAVQSLISNKVTAVIIDNEPAKAYVAANSGIKILDGAYVEEDYAICLSKKNTVLLERINVALKELKEDGTIKRIIDKYISAD